MPEIPAEPVAPVAPVMPVAPVAPVAPVVPDALERLLRVEIDELGVKLKKSQGEFSELDRVNQGLKALLKDVVTLPEAKEKLTGHAEWWHVDLSKL